MSTRIQLGLLVQAEAMRAGQIAALAAKDERAVATQIAETLTLVSIRIWDPRLGERPIDLPDSCSSASRSSTAGHETARRPIRPAGSSLMQGQPLVEPAKRLNAIGTPIIAMAARIRTPNMSPLASPWFICAAGTKPNVRNGWASSAAATAVSVAVAGAETGESTTPSSVTVETVVGAAAACSARPSGA